jgi:molybdopterin synthase catalytic subunit
MQQVATEAFICDGATHMRHTRMAMSEARVAEQSQSSDRFLIDVSETIPSLLSCYEFVTSGCTSCGAVSSFSGITRDNFQGKRVVKLTYEAYIPMAIKMMHRLCQTCCSQFPSVKKVAMVHVLGECPVGDASVIIAVSSPHRRDAMHAVEFLIDELKAHVPIWKQEVYAEDKAVWKENNEWDQERSMQVKLSHPT